MALALLPKVQVCQGVDSRFAEAPRTELSHKCNRVISRQVRRVVEKEIVKPAAKESLDKWPENCPLDPARDLYSLQEAKKSRKRGSHLQWACGFCGKVFKSEHYLDLHMERRHMKEVPIRSICLADYCEVFEVCQVEGRARRAAMANSHQDQQSCQPDVMAKARKRCEDSLSKCFPLQASASRQLHARLSRHWCQVLDCRIRLERHQDVHRDPLPVVILVILIVLVGFLFFSFVVCCVDYSEDIFAALISSRVASTDTVHRFLKVREKARESVGFDRTKYI